MATPIRKNELEALEKIARSPNAANMIEEPVLERLLALGLTQSRGGVTSISSRGTMELARRKALLRTHRSS